jgi:ubiquinone/menaquinone biosynthesis C-methylase UbiE
MQEMISHYEEVREDLRLRAGVGALELTRTQELVKRHLSEPPGVVLDVGGGPGIYSEWLAGLGYEVHLVDAVPEHVERARQVAGVASARVGDARRLEEGDGTADAVLLLGPLYHLTERGERMAALAEARRVLRRGGVLFAAGICRFASLLDGLARGFVDDPRFVEILERDLREGQHRNATENAEYFTTAFFHRPEELRGEAEEAGFSRVELVGVEGPGWVARDFERRWAEPARREQLLALVRAVESEPTLIGASLHLLVMGWKV